MLLMVVLDHRAPLLLVASLAQHAQHDVQKLQKWLGVNGALSIGIDTYHEPEWCVTEVCIHF